MNKMKKVVLIHPRNKMVIEIVEQSEEVCDKMLEHEFVLEYVEGVQPGWVCVDGVLTPPEDISETAVEAKCALINATRLEKQRNGLPYLFNGVSDIVQLRDETDKNNVDRLVLTAMAEVLAAGGVDNVTTTFNFIGMSNVKHVLTAAEVLTLGKAVKDFLENLTVTAGAYKRLVRRVPRPVNPDELFAMPNWPN